MDLGRGASSHPAISCPPIKSFCCGSCYGAHQGVLWPWHCTSLLACPVKWARVPHWSHPSAHLPSWESPPAAGFPSSHLPIVALRASSTLGHACLGFSPANVPPGVDGKTYDTEVLLFPKTAQTLRFFLKTSLNLKGQVKKDSSRRRERGQQ